MNGTALIPEPDPATLPGWYGKLAGLGDFASRRLPQTWIEQCDRWLSDCLTSSRAELGSAWLDAYLSAPLWRFAWAPGVAGEQWWFGVLMASCDNVGRYYPLVVTQAVDQAPGDGIALARLEQWYLHITHVAMRTLHGGPASVESLEEALALAPAWHAPTGGMPVTGSAAPGALSWPPMSHRDTLTGWLERAAVQALQRQMRGCSLWWSWLPDEPSGPVRVLPGLPRPEQFGAMLDGRW